MRYCNGCNTRLLGKLIFLLLFLLALIILFSCCETTYTPVKMNLKSMHTYDYCEIVSNHYLKSEVVFRQDVEAQALYQTARKNWARHEIRYFETHRIHGKYIGYAIIYYWKEK